MIRCEFCGASNPDGAAWCGQCFAPVRTAPAPTAPAPSAAAPPATPAAEAAPEAAPAPTEPAPTEPAPPEHAQSPTGDGPPPAEPEAEVTTRGFRRRADGELDWECTGCGEYNPLGVDRCALCGTPFAARWEKPAAPPPPPAAFTNALLYSVVLPGAGHLSLQHTGSGILRLLLFISWLVAAIMLVAAGGPLLLTAGPLLAGVLVVWAATLTDVLRLRDGQPEILRGRTIVWLIAAVVGLEVLGLFAASLTYR